MVQFDILLANLSLFSNSPDGLLCFYSRKEFAVKHQLVKLSWQQQPGLPFIATTNKRTLDASDLASLAVTHSGYDHCAEHYLSFSSDKL
jgi:hypothetical protein